MIANVFKVPARPRVARHAFLPFGMMHRRQRADRKLVDGRLLGHIRKAEALGGELHVSLPQFARRTKVCPDAIVMGNPICVMERQYAAARGGGNIRGAGMMLAA